MYGLHSGFKHWVIMTIPEQDQKPYWPLVEAKGFYASVAFSYADIGPALYGTNDAPVQGFYRPDNTAALGRERTIFTGPELMMIFLLGTFLGVGDFIQYFVYRAFIHLRALGIERRKHRLPDGFWQDAGTTKKGR